MSYRTKLLVLTLLPVALISLALFFVIQRQAENLIAEQSRILETAILEQKRQELRNYVTLAEKAIDPSYSSVLKTERRAQAEANQILRKMSATEDQYFFIFDGEGNNIIEPHLTFFMGRNWINLTDLEGRKIIQETIAASQAEDEFVTYTWQKPSTKDYTQKMVHSTYFPKWDWVVGTGLYLDDIEREVANVAANLDTSFRRTERTMLLLIIAGVLSSFTILTWFNFSQQRQADQKLRLLNTRLVDIQEAERKRVSHDLHDRISQLLVSSRYGLENALGELRPNSKLKGPIQTSMAAMDDAIAEVRRISLALRPSTLDDMGLAAALKSLGSEFERNTQIAVTTDVAQVRNLLSDESKTTLYRIAQEGLTNVAKHSSATEVRMALTARGRRIYLDVIDNGTGLTDSEATEGLGMRNMQERIESLGGEISFMSPRKGGLRIAASLPIETDQARSAI